MEPIDNTGSGEISRGPASPSQSNWWPGAAGATTPPDHSGEEATSEWPSTGDPARAQWAPPRYKPQRSGSAVGPIALVLAALLLLAAGVVIGHGLWTRTVGSASLPPRMIQPTSPTAVPGSSGPADAATIASRVDPSLVDINTTLSYQQAAGAGTGMVLTPTGEVLTNNHVIEGETGISVTDVGNGRTYDATVVGYDVTADVAILQLQGASNLKTVSLGNSSNVTVGEKVVAIGNAEGRGGTPSYAGGEVTALNQTITASDALEGSRQLTGLIESSAYIQPGDSGGPVVNDNGQVIAMDTAASEGFAGFESGGSPSYSIPINEAMAVARQVESGHSSSTVHVGPTAFLGIQVEANPFGPGGFGVQTPPINGVFVASVLAGEPAAQAGIAAGDVITSVGGAHVSSPSTLTAVLGNYHPGNKVQVDWTDPSGQQQSAMIQLASGPPQ
jgi:S1-C subfamily serine protease